MIRAGDRRKGRAVLVRSVSSRPGRFLGGCGSPFFVVGWEDLRVSCCLKGVEDDLKGNSEVFLQESVSGRSGIYNNEHNSQ